MSLALALMRAGLARLHPAADPSRLADGAALLEAQQAAKQARLKVRRWLAVCVVQQIGCCASGVGCRLLVKPANSGGLMSSSLLLNPLALVY